MISTQPVSSALIPARFQPYVKNPLYWVVGLLGVLFACAVVRSLRNRVNSAQRLFNEGMEYLVKKDVVKAFEKFEEALNNSPSNGLRAEILFHLIQNPKKTIEEVIEDFTTILNLNPAESLRRSALNERGLAYLETYQLQKAIDDFTAVLGVLPKEIPEDKQLYAQVLINRARGYSLQKGGEEKKLQDLNQVLELFPNNVSALFYRAVLYAEIQKNHFDLALEDLNTASKEATPKELSVIALMQTSVFYRQRTYETAVPKIEAALSDENSELLEIWYLLKGKVLFKQGKIGDALAACDAGLHVETENIVSKVRLLYFRAKIHHSQKNYPLALQDYNQAEDLVWLFRDSEAKFFNKRHVKILFRLSEISRVQNIQGRAIHKSELIVSSTTATNGSHLREGMNRFNLGEFGAAILHYTNALKLNEGSKAEVFVRRAEAYRLGGNFAMALQDYAAAKASAPDSPYGEFAQIALNYFEKNPQS